MYHLERLLSVYNWNIVDCDQILLAVGPRSL